MKTMLKISLVLTGAFFTNLALAFYCPSSATYIQIGQSYKQVDKACGKPLSIKVEHVPTYQKEISKKIYYVQKKEDGKINKNNIVSFEFTNQKLNKIFTGNPQYQKALCKGAVIQFGESYDSVIKQCGKPTYTEQAQQKIENGLKDVEIWTYQFGDYAPKTDMIFINGKLKAIKAG